MPMVTTEKQCAWCGKTWKPTKPNAGAVQGFDFLDDDDFVTSVEAASLLGTTRQTVANWIETGRIKAGEGKRHGRGYPIQVRVGDVRRLMRRQAQQESARVAVSASSADTTEAADLTGSWPAGRVSTNEEAEDRG